MTDVCRRCQDFSPSVEHAEVQALWSHAIDPWFDVQTGVRVDPHMVRKVLDRDGAVLEEWEKTTYKVVNEYVALTMAQMMRGVVTGGTGTGFGTGAGTGPGTGPGTGQ